MQRSKRVCAVVTVSALLTSLLALQAFAAPPATPPLRAKTIPKDQTPPTGTILINANASYTDSPSVTLTLAAIDNSGTVATTQFSNDNFTYSALEPYATTKTWQLSSGDGTKTVFVKFLDPAGNVSQPASDTIVLDTTPPDTQITVPVDGQVIGIP